MARATDLPIYREAYDLLLMVTRLTQSYPRGYRQGLARDICLVAQDVVNLIFAANGCVAQSQSAELVASRHE